MISLVSYTLRASIVARNELRTIFPFARLHSQWTRPSRLSSALASMASITDILAGKYPAKLHAQRVAKSLVQQGGDKDGVIYLEAQKTVMQEDSDHPAPFRQRRFFYYLTGCNLPDCYLTYDMFKDHLTLFIPPIDPEDVVWSGLPLTLEEAMEKYDIDAVKTTDEINPCLANKDQTPQSTVYAIDGQVSTHITFLSFANKDMDLLKKTIENCRVVKSDYEIAMIRHANEVSTKAHVACMRTAKKVKNEQELQAIFIEHCIAQGCKEQAYTGIFASGEAAATLHYIHNDKATSGKLNLLLDAGAEYRCYASDITRTFPLDGKFTKESRAIYDIVLRMQMECISMLEEGVLWDDVHAHAHKVAIEGLLDLGILHDGTVQEIFDARTSVAFFPHGLGHYLGMDTHDTGGNANYSDKDQMFRYLRVRGTLPAGSVITVEPGVYFCRFIIEPYLKDPTHGKYINSDVLEKYWQVGGVRIEDNVLITKDGSENLTPTPKTVEEMEQIMTY